VAVSAGTRLGPYEILEPLGAGGMGEVYRARDTRLEREVAVKVLRPEVASDPDRLRRFEREARTVAALNHPHILTVHDVGTHEGTPYVVTELLEGETLRQVLKSRSPTRKQILSFAVQIARGLAAAHDKDIVHRDLKPENLFLTTDGRIKILDFGLAKLTARETDLRSADTLGAEEHSTSPGVILGTVAYMSPEQARALPLDPGSDIFSFGVVLYEMLAHKHPFLRDTAPATLSAILNDTPPDLVSLGRGVPPALGSLVQRCLEKERQDRFRGAHDLALALEAVLQAPSGAAALLEIEERSPYPGLSSFTERDAAVFFGREREVKTLWEKLRSRNLLAVIGPSGAGKTSFVRAGVLPARPEGWTALVCAPGRTPMRALGRALAPELAGDTEALSRLLDFEELDVAVELLMKWRRAHDEALVVVDQFEELFTQSPPEAQALFAQLVGRLTKEADVHVLLSLRDDFLMRCHPHEPLARVFSELTPLDTLTREGLRQAVVEPAKARGYVFEDDALVDEMLDAVEGARGALPLLAFAVSRLWETRDRETKRLTREAYEEIGGVAGALAQHAEQTLERIGGERQAMVREIFRNLVTSQGTRASIDREELLSVFPERAVAEVVLEELIDARLLTSYEIAEPGGADTAAPGGTAPPSRHRVEIVHESLLRAWPRLVMWQAQEEEGAVLRDQLKQAAHLWDEKSRTPDLLWSGTAFREFELWRERYPGKLTALEEDFAAALVGRARRQKRLRRLAVASVVVVLGAVAAAIAVSRQREAQARRQAEAAELLALGRLELDDRPTAGLAYALASLETADNPAARRYALETLAHGAAAFVLPGMLSVSLSHDGRWLAASALDGTRLWSRDGNPPVSLVSSPAYLQFDRRRPLLMVTDAKARRIFSVPDGRERLRRDLSGEPERGIVRVFLRDARVFTLRRDAHGGTVHARPAEEGESRLVGRWNHEGATDFDVSPDPPRLAYVRGRQVVVVPLEGRDASPRLLGEHSAAAVFVAFAPGDTRLVTADEAGEIRIWRLDGTESPLERTIRSGLARAFALVDRAGSILVAGRTGPLKSPELAFAWDLNGPPDAGPLTLRNGDVPFLNAFDLDPDGLWLATANVRKSFLWPLGRRGSWILRGQAPPQIDLAFTPDGKWLSSYSQEGVLRLWPMSPAVASGQRALLRDDRPGASAGTIAMDPKGRHVLVMVSYAPGRVVLVPLDGGAPRVVRSLSPGWLQSPAVSRDGRLAAAGTRNRPEGNLLEVWDLRSGDVRTLDPRPRENEKECGPDATRTSAVMDVEFTSDGRLLGAGFSGLRLWSLDDGTNVLLRPCTRGSNLLFPFLAASREDRYLLLETDMAAKTSSLSFHDLRAGGSHELTSHGNAVASVALDPKGEVAVTGGWDGIVRVGPVTGEEPHLLYGHDLEVTSVAVSPDGRWIASASNDGTIRLWPMPAGRPFHTLPHAELVARLGSFTNLRVVRDEASETGYRVEAGPFPGWGVVPDW
jgi:serine/threonine protein kinase/WD40 repeat protein